MKSTGALKAIRSSSFIARADGILGSGSGWVTSASGESLRDLNSLLRGGPHADHGDRFSLIVGDTAILPNVKYVITLDTDTQLPRDSARQFVGAMAHPLNRARYDEDKQRVCEGYGILQPRVAVSLPGTNRSRYARMCGSEPGIDPYTRAVSDVYQDLFR